MNDSFTEHKEPDEIFSPLNARRYAEFYSLEMDSFTKDIEFYSAHCNKGLSVLELGCGTGRISRALAASGYTVTGLDLSLAMLKHAKEHSANPPSYICMDMSKMALRLNFDHILIPYNTLNLLRDTALIITCLQQTRHHLKPSGSLLLQLHIPDAEMISNKGQKHFQFQMFPLGHRPGKLIKETLRNYNYDTQEVCLEERYRVRPTDDSTSREDFRHIIHLAAFPVQQWLNILEHCGFQNYTLFGDFNSRPFNLETDSTLLIEAFPLKKT